MENQAKYSLGQVVTFAFGASIGTYTRGIVCGRSVVSINGIQKVKYKIKLYSVVQGHKYCLSQVPTLFVLEEHIVDSLFSEFFEKTKL